MGTGSTFCGGGSGAGAVCVTPEGGVETAVREGTAGCVGATVCALAAGRKKIAHRAKNRMLARAGWAAVGSAPVAVRAQQVRVGWVTAPSLLEPYLESSRIASSRPMMVSSGYMRRLTSCWITLMLWRYCQISSGCRRALRASRTRLRTECLSHHSRPWPAACQAPNREGRSCLPH